MLTRTKRLLEMISVLVCAGMNAAVPVNDSFVNATLLAPPPSSVIGTAVDATVEPSEPAIWHTERTVWWYWVATKSGTVALRGLQDPAPYATIFSGTELTNLALITSGILFHYSPMIFYAEEGQTYYVRIHAAAEIECRFEAGLGNDAFADAFSINGRFAQVSGDNTLATLEPGEGGEGAWLQATLWWKWIAPESGRFRLSTNGSDAAIEAWLLQGSFPSFQALIGGGNGESGVNVVEGQTYYIRIASPLGRRGRFLVSLFPSRPINDLFTDRIVLTNAAGRVVGSNIGATNQAGEPVLDTGYGAARSTVWWSWIAPTDGRLVLNCPASPFTRFGLAIYTGTSVRRLSRLGFGDQRASAPVIAGRAYAIQVDGAWNTRADFYLDYQLMTVPTNDTTAGARELIGPSVHIADDNSAGTLDRREGKITTDASGASLWYVWKAPKTGWCWLKVTSHEPYALAFVPFARVFEALPSARPLATTSQINSGIASATGFGVTEGVTYWIAVDSSLGRRGPFELDLDLTTLRIAQPTAGSVVSQTDLTSFAIPATDLTIDGPLQSIELIVTKLYDPPLAITSVASLPAVFQMTNLPAGLNEFAIRATNSEGRQRLSPSVTLLVRPANDSFTTAASGSGYAWHSTAEFQGATTEPGDRLRGGPSLWWEWTAPASGVARVSSYFFPRYSRMKLKAYVGDGIEALKPVLVRTEVDRSEGVLSIRFRATEGVTYRITANVDSMSARRGFSTSVDAVLQTAEIVLPEGTSFAQGKAVPIAINTTERLETIQHIEFFDYGKSIGVVSNGLTFVWSNAPCGPHYVSAAIRKFGDVQPPTLYGVLFYVRPANDDFSDATVIGSFPSVVQSCTSSANREPDEPMHKGFITAGSVWWRFTPQTNGRLLVAQSGLVEPFPFYPYFALYTGSSLDRLTLVATNGDPHNGGYDLAVNLTGGTTYHLATSSSDELQFRFYVPPANDDFIDSIEIVGTNTTVHSHTVLATSEPGEPLHSQHAGTNTVWWHWHAPTNGCIRLELSSAPVSAQLAVYEGDRVDQLVPFPPLDSSRWITRPGRTYRFAVASSWQGIAEEVSLRFEFQSAATNDMFDSAVAVSGEFVTFDANTLGATAEPGEPTRPNAAGTSLWWRWTAPKTGTVRIQGDGTPGGGLIFEVFTGVSLETLTPVTSVDPFYRRQFYAVQGQTYHIMVDSIVEFPAADGVELFFEAPRP